MKYMMLIYTDENSYSNDVRESCYAESAAFARELSTTGRYLGASPLHNTKTATSVRVRDGKRFVTDGPFAETREQLGGYFLIDAADMEEAVDIAGRIPGARLGTVEIRPIMVIDGLPEDTPVHEEALATR